MKNLRLADIYYYLPIFLLGLSASPNIVGWRIGLTLIGSLVLAVPVSNIITIRLKELLGTTYKFKVMDAVVLIIIALMVWVCTHVNYYYLSAQLVFVMAYVILGLAFTNSRIKVLFSLLVGVLFFATIYLGLNQYGFRMLIRKELLEFIILASCLFAFLYMLVVDLGSRLELPPSKSFSHVNKQLGILYRITFIIFIITLWRSYPYEYPVVFLIIQLPVVYSYTLLQKAINGSSPDMLGIKFKVFRQIAVSCFNIFLIYLFLESTQVLQAVLGGY